MADFVWTGETSGNWSTTTNWDQGSLPGDGDNIFFVADYPVDLTASLDRTAVAFDYGKITVEKGYTGKIGTKTARLQIRVTGLDFSGSGLSYIDLNTSAVDVTVNQTASAASGKNGLYLLGSALDEINILSGNVGIAARAGKTATVATITVNGGNLTIGDGCTLTNLTVYSGGVTCQASVTTLKNYGGTIDTVEAAAITTLTVFNGTNNHNGTGTVATANIEGGVLDLFRSGLPRTVTTLNLKPGGGLVYDPDTVTISTLNISGGPISISSNNA